MFRSNFRKLSRRKNAAEDEVLALQDQARDLAGEIDDLEKFLCQVPEVSARRKLQRMEDMHTIPPPEEWDQEPPSPNLLMPRHRAEAIRKHRRQSFFLFLLVAGAVAATAHYLAEFL